jgi:hypothetical protein
LTNPKQRIVVGAGDTLRVGGADEGEDTDRGAWETSGDAARFIGDGGLMCQFIRRGGRDEAQPSRSDRCYSQDNLTGQDRGRRRSDHLSVSVEVVAVDGFEEVACGVDGGVGAVGVGQVESVPGPGDFEVSDRRARH